jgi:hypothetical protein
LPQWEAVELAKQQTYLNGDIGISLWSTPARIAFFGFMPIIDRFFAHPDTDIATLPKGLIIFRPIGHFIFHLFEFVAARVSLFVWHWTVSSE